MAGSVKSCRKKLHANSKVHLLSFLLPPPHFLFSKLRTEAGPPVALAESQVSAWELGVRYLGLGIDICLVL